MDDDNKIQIISFYEFKRLADAAPLDQMRAELKQAFVELNIRGTIILADEGYNGMVCGTAADIERFIAFAGRLFQSTLIVKSHFHDKAPFRKIDVKIKPEIVTLKQDVDISLGKGTHVDAAGWNRLILDDGTLILDARNNYEYETGTFRGAVNPNILKFSELPAFVAESLDPATHKRIAMFCTGGIRCEKFAPYMRQIGFDEVYQLDGGILRYLEETPPGETLWEGECFVFDERITVDASLNKGTGPDHSQRHAGAKRAPYKVPE